MIFDWNDFRRLAEELQQNEDEASKRTAISQLYYALYWRARNLLEDEGFVYRQSEQSHQQVWQEFKRRGMTHRAVAFASLELRDKRVEAYYFEEIENIEKITNSAFAVAEKMTVFCSKSRRKRKINYITHESKV